MKADDRNGWIDAANRWIQDQHCAFLAAERENRLIGFIIGWLQMEPPVFLADPVGFVTELVMDIHIYQGGLGRMLMQSLREWFNAQGVHRIAVLMPHNYAAEQAFWRSLGATQWIDLMWTT